MHWKSQSNVVVNRDKRWRSGCYQTDPAELASAVSHMASQPHLSAFDAQFSTWQTGTSIPGRSINSESAGRQCNGFDQRNSDAAFDADLSATHARRYDRSRVVGTIRVTGVCFFQSRWRDQSSDL